MYSIHQWSVEATDFTNMFIKKFPHHLYSRSPSILMAVWMFFFSAAKAVGFWCQTIHKTFLRRFDTIFGLKMMMKSGLKKLFWNSTMAFRVAAAQCKKICPERLNWQVSRYLWRPPWNFKIFFSRPLFIIILSQIWFQDLRFYSIYSTSSKGQIISECPYEIIVWTKIPMKKFPRFLP